MRNLFLLVFALAIFSISASAQNTPAPCDPANLQPSDVKYGCYNTPDCITGFMCFFIRVETDVFYGTTCSETPMYLCSTPNGLAQKEESHAKTVLARIRSNRSRLVHHAS